eukprot:4912554-Pleurochrysis_carterae.AAC.1
MTRENGLKTRAQNHIATLHVHRAQYCAMQRLKECFDVYCVARGTSRAARHLVSRHLLYLQWHWRLLKLSTLA